MAQAVVTQPLYFLNMNNKRRVVVTGIGIVSSVGTGKDAFWKAITKGKSGISKISLFDTKGFKCHYGGEVKKFEPTNFILLLMPFSISSLTFVCNS